jgi:Sec-independent protein translocase protein TatA
VLGIGFPELVVILILLLVVFRPEQLVELVRTAGGLAERLRRTGREIRDQVEGELHATVWERPRDEGAERAPVKPSPLALAPPPSDKDAQPAPHRETDGG